MNELTMELKHLTTVVEAAEQRAAYAVDGLVPRVVLLPASPGEVASCLACASRHGAAVAPRGGGTKGGLGNPPRRLDIVLSLERLNQVIEYVPEDLTVTVRAGMRLRDLQDLVSRHGQTVPLDSPRAARATVGGIVAAGCSGPRRVAYGGPRDILLGTQVALSDGRLIKTGGRVVKNVAGYDMNKLLVGSLGTLGVMTELTLKLRPEPAHSQTLRVGFADLADALKAAEAIMQSELLPTALTLLSPGVARRLGSPGPVTLAVELAESATNVAYQAERIAAITAGAPGDQLAEKEEAAFWEAIRNWGDVSGAVYEARVATVVSDLEHQLRSLLESPLGEPMDAIAHVSAGTLLVYGFDAGEGASVMAGLFTRARDSGGMAVLEAAPPELKQRVDVWGPPRPEWKLMQGIKRAMDPAGILNPGRFVGGI